MIPDLNSNPAVSEKNYTYDTWLGQQSCCIRKELQIWYLTWTAILLYQNRTTNINNIFNEIYYNKECKIYSIKAFKISIQCTEINDTGTCFSYKKASLRVERVCVMKIWKESAWFLIKCYSYFSGFICMVMNIESFFLIT